MPAIGKTTEFPRKDNYYTKKESLPYDESQTKIWRNRERRYSREKVKEWIAYCLVGLFCGTVAFGMIHMEEFLLDKVNIGVRNLIRGRDCEIAEETIEDLTIKGENIMKNMDHTNRDAKHKEYNDLLK